MHDHGPFFLGPEAGRDLRAAHCFTTFYIAISPCCKRIFNPFRALLLPEGQNLRRRIKRPSISQITTSGLSTEICTRCQFGPARSGWTALPSRSGLKIRAASPASSSPDSRKKRQQEVNSRNTQPGVNKRHSPPCYMAGYSRAQ